MARTVRRRQSVILGSHGLGEFGGLGLDLFEHQRSGGEVFDAARTGLDHFALGSQSLEQLQGWASWLDASAVPHSEIRTLDGDIGAMFDFVDPDGIQIESIYVDHTKLA